MALCTCRSILGRKGRGRQILAIILVPGLITESIMTHYCQALVQVQVRAPVPTGPKVE